MEEAPRAETRRSILLEIAAFWALTAVSISAAWHAGLSDDWVAVIKAVALIYLPLGWMFRTRRDLARYALQASDPARSIGLFVIVAVATLLPFWLGNHFFVTHVLHQRFLRLRLPEHFAMLMLGELLSVALPEEVFYRGYLQTRMEEAIPSRWRLFGAPIGWALPLTSLIFVAGHLAVRPAGWELLIFFPSLVFGWLRAKTGSLVAPVLYHAVCNVGMAILQASYG